MSLDREHENEEVSKVVDRLAERFPHLDRSHIEGLVDEKHHALDGNPIRDFVPVLVEHDAKTALKQNTSATA